MIKRIGEKEIFKTKLFTIKDITLQSDSQTVVYQILEKNNTALLVPVLPNGDVIFVKEYFAAIDEYQLALPKGRVEDGDNELERANKELQEEVGYKAAILTKLAVVTMSPGYLTQKTHVFLAQDLIESSLEGDELEKLEVVTYPLEKFEELIDKGKLTESRVIAALYLAKRKLAR
jgi:ADP-ribose diphosphatase